MKDNELNREELKSVSGGIIDGASDVDASYEELRLKLIESTGTDIFEGGIARDDVTIASISAAKNTRVPASKLTERKRRTDHPRQTRPVRQ